MRHGGGAPARGAHRGRSTKPGGVERVISSGCGVQGGARILEVDGEEYVAGVSASALLRSEARNHTKVVVRRQLRGARWRDGGRGRRRASTDGGRNHAGIGVSTRRRRRGSEAQPAPQARTRGLVSASVRGRLGPLTEGAIVVSSCRSCSRLARLGREIDAGLERDECRCVADAKRGLGLVGAAGEVKGGEDGKENTKTDRMRADEMEEEANAECRGVGDA